MIYPLVIIGGKYTFLIAEIISTLLGYLEPFYFLINGKLVGVIIKA
ncbi:uncharacterized protein METZ01_LOCUS498747 [marine metagenome]|jgi:hypothetical protein|uniref:Uncharacterized protein n=1 Tax=marine metagenome TaxID=408172 RepID=A0A383DNP4_9ZZZZ|tara:strand:+ start:1500 stop:1637 length:138 start_codon:yes stop_codon:yes gene_type:complete